MHFLHCTAKGVSEMNESDLRKLSRTDLLEILLEQSRELDECRAQLERANQRLSEREIVLTRAGSIAEAALQLNGVFSAAENACAQYMDSIKSMSSRQEEICARMERETQQKCEKMVAEAQRQSEAYWELVNQKVQQLLDAHKYLRHLLGNYL